MTVSGHPRTVYEHSHVIRATRLCFYPFIYVRQFHWGFSNFRPSPLSTGQAILKPRSERLTLTCDTSDHRFRSSLSHPAHRQPPDCWVCESLTCFRRRAGVAYVQVHAPQQHLWMSLLASVVLLDNLLSVDETDSLLGIPALAGRLSIDLTGVSTPLMSSADGSLVTEPSLGADLSSGIPFGRWPFSAAFWLSWVEVEDWDPKLPPERCLWWSTK